MDKQFEATGVTCPACGEESASVLKQQTQEQSNGIVVSRDGENCDREGSRRTLRMLIQSAKG